MLLLWYIGLPSSWALESSCTCIYACSGLGPPDPIESSINCCNGTSWGARLHQARAYQPSQYQFSITGGNIPKCLLHLPMWWMYEIMKPNEQKTGPVIYNSFWVLSLEAERAALNWRLYRLCNTLSFSSSSRNVGRLAGSLWQQLSIIETHCGSTSFGISSLWFINPTAPITCKYSTNYCSYAHTTCH